MTIARPSIDLTTVRLRKATEHACTQLGIHMIYADTKPTETGWHIAPAGAAALNRSDDQRLIWLRTIDMEHSEGWIWVLHEIEHHLFWHPELRLNVPEQLMMPFTIAVLRAAGLSAKQYFDSAYTRYTVLPEMYHRGKYFNEVGSWSRPLSSGWYRRAYAANIAAGTIGADGLPTWRAPDWGAIRIPEHQETFTIP